MELSIMGFSQITNYELIEIDGGRNVAQVAIGTAGLIAITGAVVIAAIYCPAAINKGTISAAALGAVSCVQAIASGW